MGGAQNPDDALPIDHDIFAWLLKRAGGGDWVVLTADPDTDWDLYNAYLYQNFTGMLNSVTTIRFVSRDGSFQPTVIERVQNAAGIFFTGGDQSRYELFWRESPISDAIAQLMRQNRPIGGESAGLAVLGHIVFTALYDSIDSDEALANPFDKRVTLSRDLFALPFTAYMLTDTHFLQRDRMGRLLVFAARAVNASWGGPDGNVLALGVSEHSAVLLDIVSGRASFAGAGPLYFLQVGPHAGDVMRPDAPLSWGPVTVHRWRAQDGHAAWWDAGQGRWSGLTQYQIGARDGRLYSTQPGGHVY